MLRFLLTCYCFCLLVLYLCPPCCVARSACVLGLTSTRSLFFNTYILMLLLLIFEVVVLQHELQLFKKGNKVLYSQWNAVISITRTISKFFVSIFTSGYGLGLWQNYCCRDSHNTMLEKMSIQRPYFLHEYWSVGSVKEIYTEISVLGTA